MIVKKKQGRQIPGIISYMELFSSRKLSYAIFIGTPFILGLISLLLNNIWIKNFDLLHFIRFVFLFLFTSGLATLFSMGIYSTKSPILKAPPTGWSVQMNAFFSVIIEITFIFGQIVVILLNDIRMQEVFLLLGTILSYIVAFVIYFSFTTSGRFGNIILSLIQPLTVLVLYGLYTGQFDTDFFIRAMIFFFVCALFFAIPYRRGLFKVSNIYQEVTGMRGYAFIRAFVLSMMTDGNDDLIEHYFDEVGIASDVKIQYLLIRSSKTKTLKGLFIVPNVHFGPFKTCGSSDLPEQIYRAFPDVPGTTVFHTTNTHAQNLTSQHEVDKVFSQIRRDVDAIIENRSTEWNSEVVDFSRKISNSAKLIGMIVNQTPILFLTRHPLPSDDIHVEVGYDIRTIAKNEGFKDVIVIDSHNSIIGNEILIKRDSIEANDLINVSERFIIKNKPELTTKTTLLYGVAKDSIEEFSEKDGIGYGGLVVHLFKNTLNDQKTVLIHFDGNNAFLEIRSFILNMLQNQGIEKGEITTSDSHTVARQFSSRGYSPIGDKIKLDFILEKLNVLLEKAEKDLEPVEFYSKHSHKNVRIWGDPRYFDVIIETLKECIRVSQSLLTISLIGPTFISLILLIFLYTV
jgi:putative membrane protein